MSIMDVLDVKWNAITDFFKRFNIKYPCGQLMFVISYSYEIYLVQLDYRQISVMAFPCEKIGNKLVFSRLRHKIIQNN